ncbi:MAG: YraN family protein [Flavobacteriaceae bacterium]|jgi:Holliday junction resolvase-like predicted endonuclease|nr:YraN family protein [Flavobacteriaceae bacterium]
MNTLDKGRDGEDMACAYLKKQGYRIKSRNFYYQKAELDIVASKDDTLAIVEVKWRLSDFYGSPETFVTPKNASFWLVPQIFMCRSLIGKGKRVLISLVL